MMETPLTEQYARIMDIGLLLDLRFQALLDKQSLYTMQDVQRILYTTMRDIGFVAREETPSSSRYKFVQEIHRYIKDALFHISKKDTDSMRINLETILQKAKTFSDVCALQETNYMWSKQ